MLDKVLAETARYEHPLFDFSARDREGAIELVIQPKDRSLDPYYGPLHSHDIEHPQFAWTFQRYLYDCLHDYVVEMFTRTPQTRDART